MRNEAIFVMFIILINNQATYDRTADKNVELDQRQNSRETLGLCNF
jgi:hypothetical protein